ncbi:MAG: family 6 glucosyltransferase [Patescibacteria group bacterium]
MEIGILYICTGKYKIFWKKFYLSCEKNFITEAEKEYFVFTDAESIDFEKENKNIHKIYQENLGWPNNTIKRYEIFLKSKKKMEEMDYLFFFNANIVVLKNITTEEFLPHGQEKIVGCLHPGYYNKPIKKFTYENNPLSKAFIERKEGLHYYSGGINGGETKSFLNIIEMLNNNINEDYKNKIIAVWHDESHWNWYLNNHPDMVKNISPSYCYPEGASLPFEQKMLVRDKDLLGGFSSFRNKIELRLIVNKIKRSVKKYYKH